MPKIENPIMQYFTYAHLPEHLKGVSQVIASAAKLLNQQLADGPEKSSGLRKLLEAKDCFVRSALNMPNAVKAGDLSDGYHSFNELYANRMNLFAVICHQNKSRAWKSKQHHDGSMFPEYFIVGLNTPEGQFTYHYHADHWNLFDVVELDNAPEWDGHTANDVTRLHSLEVHIMQYADDPNTPEQPNEIIGSKAQYACNPNLSGAIIGGISCDSYSRMEVRAKGKGTP